MFNSNNTDYSIDKQNWWIFCVAAGVDSWLWTKIISITHKNFNSHHNYLSVTSCVSIMFSFPSWDITKWRLLIFRCSCESPSLFVATNMTKYSKLCHEGSIIHTTRQTLLLEICSGFVFQGTDIVPLLTCQWYIVTYHTITLKYLTRLRCLQKNYTLKARPPCWKGVKQSGKMK